MTKQKRNFRMDPHLLVDIIKKQTGSIDRAIQEAIQNSVDSGATAIHISVTHEVVKINDNGRGFRSEEEITDLFETFGKPHTAAEAKVFGQFRMGRGQLFAHGKNIWRTNEFAMDIDIENPDSKYSDDNALGYHLYRNTAPVAGCEIEIQLYNKLSYSSLMELEHKIEKAFKYVATPVYLNGKRISVDPHEMNWEFVSDFCVANLSLDHSHMLNIYNLGVLVRSYSCSEFGMSGDIVSTAAMQLNFSRDQAMDTCPVFQDMRSRFSEWQLLLCKKQDEEDKAKKKQASKNKKPTVRKEPSDYSKNKPKYSADEISKRIDSAIVTGAFSDRVYDPVQPYITGFDLTSQTIKGSFSVVKLNRMAKQTAGRIALARRHSAWPPTDPAIIRAAKLGLVTLIAEKTVDRFNVYPSGEINKRAKALIAASNAMTGFKLKMLDKEEVEQLLRLHAIEVKQSSTSTAEKALVDAIKDSLAGLFSYEVYGQILEVSIVEFGYATTKFALSEDGRRLFVGRDYLKNWTTYRISGIYEMFKDIYTVLGEKLKVSATTFALNMPMAAYTFVGQMIRNTEEEFKESRMVYARLMDTLQTIYKKNLENNLHRLSVEYAYRELGRILESTDPLSGAMTLKEALTDPRSGEFRVNITEQMRLELEELSSKELELPDYEPEAELEEASV